MINQTTLFSEFTFLGNRSLLDSHNSFIAIIGTRHPNEYGLKQAKKFTEYFSRQGTVIVSGLARGIDTVAHETALCVGGKTIAVVGCGLDVVYPPENKKLFKKIAESSNGLIISQFEKGTPPLGKNFLKRNKVIASISDKILVVQGKKRSGTLNTARYGAELGRDVWAIPGPIDSPLSEAAHILIQQGAGLAHMPEDLQ